MLKLSLNEIFITKSLFWLIISNLVTFSIINLLRKKYKISITIFLISISFFFAMKGIINKKLAFEYYKIFLNQSVGEEYLTEPILIGGFYVGEHLMKDIPDKNFRLRRYAISGLASINYYPAIPVFKTILLDSMENEYIRADVYKALTELNTKESINIVTDFKNNSSSQDKKVIELGELFMKD